MQSFRTGNCFCSFSFGYLPLFLDECNRHVQPLFLPCVALMSAFLWLSVWLLFGTIHLIYEDANFSIWMANFMKSFTTHVVHSQIQDNRKFLFKLFIQKEKQRPLFGSLFARNFHHHLSHTQIFHSNLLKQVFCTCNEHDSIFQHAAWPF